LPPPPLLPFAAAVAVRRRCCCPPPLSSYREPPLVAPSTPRRCIYSLRSGELPTKVRRAFPATFLISGEFRFHPEVHLDHLYAVMYSFPRIHLLLIMFICSMHLFP
jgi:hypothetical protein